MPSHLKILFVDDHSVLIRSLGATLKKRKKTFDFFYANNKTEAISILKETEIHIMILDLNLNMEDGLNFIDDFKSINPALKILVFTMYNDLCHIDKAMKSNIQGYITKDCEIEEFENAILQVADGKNYFSDQTNAIIDSFILDDKISFHDDEIKNYFSIYKTLSPKEKEIFELCADLKDTKEISTILKKSERTIQNQKNSIYGKFHISTATEFLKIAKILGFII